MVAEPKLRKGLGEVLQLLVPRILLGSRFALQDTF